MRKRYAIVGCSIRSAAFINEIQGSYKEHAEIVAFLDTNITKMNFVKEYRELDVPCFKPDEFYKMIDTCAPDCLLVSTTDSTHDYYIVEGLKRNIDVICEKPMTTNIEKVRAIVDAEKESDAELIITFNYRYHPLHTKMKEMILNGAIGKPVQMDFNYFLDTFHGASYFNRWNRYEAEGGSLLVTKACHHFDLISWWLGQKPVEIFCYGKRNYYGEDGSHNPEKIDGRRCFGNCETKCDYFRRHTTPDGKRAGDEHLSKSAYNNSQLNEKLGKDDGYYHDRCIFDSDIDTWDTFSISALYDGGAILSYSLNASTPYEGYRVAINGTDGRIETDAFHANSKRRPFKDPDPQVIRYFPLFDGMHTVEVINKGGGHFGADPIMMHEIFTGERNRPELGLSAGLDAGMMSVCSGVAARISLKTGKPVNIQDLIAGKVKE